ncbi:MAG: DUF4350 domain-containing protein [Gammaproteobacteria bacterium]
MIPRRNQIVIGVIVAATLALAAFWVYRNFELYEQQIEVGLKREARENPYLALGRFVTSYGAAVRTFPVYTRPPPPGGATLYFPAERAALSARQNAELRAFAEAGGHLIAVIHTLWEEKDKTPDALLDPLGAAQFENKPPPVHRSKSMECPAPKAKNDEPWWKPDPRPVSLPDASGTLMLRFDQRFRLEERGNPALWRLADAFGAHALRYRVGQGSITVLTDDGLLTNAEIGKHDHAALAAWLLDAYKVKKMGHANAVWIIRDHHAPPLWAWLWKHAAPVVLAALVLLAVWLWGATRRFGPLLPDAAPMRRSLVEHITASGRFLWQHGASGALIAATGNALRQRIRARHPAWAGLPVAELSAKLAAFTGLPEPAIARALVADPRSSGERFAQDIETLESLRRRL